MRRLREMSDASSLILQFGPYKGATLAEVAMNNPEYVRQLVNRAQRPEVRAAASRLVSALEAAGGGPHFGPLGTIDELTHVLGVVHGDLG